MSRILIIDDSAFMRKIISNILESHGHEVIGEADNGKEGYDLYFKLKPDIVTMDITMPDYDGITCLKNIMHDDANAKIIMCSSLGQSKIVTEAIRAGAKDFIVKPFEASRILETVNHVSIL